MSQYHDKDVRSFVNHLITSFIRRMRPLQVDAFTRLAKALCCKRGVLCMTAQRLGLEDPMGQLIAKEKITDPEVPLTLLLSVVACLFLMSAEDPRLKT